MTGSGFGVSELVQQFIHVVFEIVDIKESVNIEGHDEERIASVSNKAGAVS